MDIGINIGPKQRWLRVLCGVAVVGVAFLPRFEMAERVVIALVGAGAILSGATGF